MAVDVIGIILGALPIVQAAAEGVLARTQGTKAAQLIRKYDQLENAIDVDVAKVDSILYKMGINVDNLKMASQGTARNSKAHNLINEQVAKQFVETVNADKVKRQLNQIKNEMISLESLESTATANARPLSLIWDIITGRSDRMSTYEGWTSDAAKKQLLNYAGLKSGTNVNSTVNQPSSANSQGPTLGHNGPDALNVRPRLK